MSGTVQGEPVTPASGSRAGRRERTLAAAKAGSLIAALALVAQSEWQLAIAVGWPWQVAWLAPVALDLYLVAAVLARRDLGVSVIVSTVSVFASHALYAAPPAWASGHAGAGHLVWPAAAGCSVVPLLVTWRIHHLGAGGDLLGGSVDAPVRGLAGDLGRGLTPDPGSDRDREPTGDLPGGPIGGPIGGPTGEPASDPAEGPAGDPEMDRPRLAAVTRSAGPDDRVAWLRRRKARTGSWDKPGTVVAQFEVSLSTAKRDLGKAQRREGGGRRARRSESVGGAG